MAKPELGTKRQCPKCGTRFYDLGKSDPITCINCGQNFVPETILKPRRPVAEPVEVKAKVVKKPEVVADDDDDLEDSDDSDMDQILEIEDEEDDIDVEVEVDVENDSDDDK